MSILVQLSDPHIRAPRELALGCVDTAAYLRHAVNAVMALTTQPDGVVISGDLTDAGTEAEYRHLAELIEPLPMPVYLMPGNHDDRRQLRRIFRNHSYLDDGEFIQYSVFVGGMKLIALDTGVEGRGEGRICALRLKWLEIQLEEKTGAPTIVAMHHPPFATMIDGMDRFGLVEGATELGALVARHQNVERVICGHIHRAVDRRFGGTIASSCPSTAHQVHLDLMPGATPKWTLEPPAFRLFALAADGHVVSHLLPSETIVRARPFV